MEESSLHLEGDSSALVSWAAAGVRIILKDRQFHSTRLLITPTRGGFVLSVPGRIARRFEGSLSIASKDRSLTAIVTMPLEAAVASVVAAESQPGTSIEALKAQAIAARSYYAAGPRHSANFEFCDTTHCQFLRHPPSFKELAARAAAETRGLLLTFAGRPIAALYSASCGGRTRTWTRSDSAAYPFYSVVCRICAGKKRRGHGIGLCQEGATSLARQGFTFRQILERYYPGTRIEVQTLMPSES